MKRIYVLFLALWGIITLMCAPMYFAFDDVEVEF